MEDNPFLGSWKLISFESEDQEGQFTYPFGENPVGYIMYAPDGYMQVAIMAEEHVPFAADRSRSGTTDEKAAAFSGYISYAGPYTIGEDTITHHVEVAWWPNMVGMDNVRAYEFNGNRLRLAVPPVEVDGKMMIQRLLWEKVEVALGAE